MSNRIKALANSALGVMRLGQLLNTESDVERQQSERLRAKRIFNSKQFNNGKVVARMPNVPSPESMSSVMWKFFFQRGSLKPQAMSVSYTHLRAHETG